MYIDISRYRRYCTSPLASLYACVYTSSRRIFCTYVFLLWRLAFAFYFVQSILIKRDTIQKVYSVSSIASDYGPRPRSDIAVSKHGIARITNSAESKGFTTYYNLIK